MMKVYFNVCLSLHVGFTLPWIHYTSWVYGTSMELIHFMGSIHFNTPGALHEFKTLQCTCRTSCMSFTLM